MNRKMQALVAATSMACVTAWAVMPAGSAFAAAPAAPSVSSDAVIQNVSEEKKIQEQTVKATAELDALLQEFDRNGLGDGADVQILKAIRNVLGNLTQNDMAKVIGLLEAAGKGDPHGATRSLADAFSGQKGISTQLRQLLIQYQHEQELADLGLNFTRLAENENENMRSGTGLYRTSHGASPRGYTEVQKAQLQVQQSQQQSIHDEAKVLLDRLTKLAADADAQTADRLKAVIALADKDKVDALLASAADDLKNSNLFSAVGKERTARDVLYDLARLAAPSKDPATALKEAADQLAKAIHDQNYLAQQDKQVVAPDKDGDETAAKLDDRQADIGDVADQVRKDVSQLTPEAVPGLKKALDEMQNSRKDLADGKGKDASDLASDAAKQLTDARKAILDEAARLEAAEKADDKIAKEQALKDAIVALRKRQELLQTQTTPVKDSKALADLAPQEAALATADRDLEKSATTDTPTVAPVLEEAGKDMDAAHDSMATKPANSEAVKSQQAAVDALKRAEQMLNDEIAKLQDIKDDLAKLQAARDKVGQMLQNEEKAELATNKLAAAQNAQQPPQTQPATQPNQQNQQAQNQQAQQAQQNQPAQNQQAQQAQQNQQGQQQQGQQAQGQQQQGQQQQGQQAQGQQQQGQQQQGQQAGNTPQNIAQQQSQVSQSANQTGQDIASSSPQAAQSLSQAAQNAQNAANNLNGSNPQGAESDAKQAMNNLQNAASTLDKQIATDQQALGQQDDSAAKLAAAQAAIDQANSDLDNAQTDPVGQMQQSQQQIANDLKNDQQSDTSAAAAAAAAAANDLAKGDLPQAGKDMAAAQAAMQKAQDSGKGDSTVAGQQKKQADLQSQLAQMAGQPDLGNTSQQLSNAAADDGSALPADAAGAMKEAAADASDASAADSAGDKDGAGKAKAKAKAALAKAKASVAMAQAGMGDGPGDDKGPGQGQADGQQPGKEDPTAKGAGDRKDANAGSDSKAGGHADLNGQSAYAGLPPRDRDAIQQSHNDKYPEEYGPMIEQYLKNLSDKNSK